MHKSRFVQKEEIILKYTELTFAEQKALLGELEKEYEAVRAQGLKLNMARGNPSAEQLALSTPLLTVIKEPEDRAEDGLDAGNYGEVKGMPCARAYFADLLGVKPENVLAGGNASLQLMYDHLMRCWAFGTKDSPRPWCKEEKVRWLCPVPGYDRHFRITERLGMELVSVPMREDGPDMDLVEEYVKDPCVKGIWCVPKYSNPDGVVYSAAVIDRFVHLKPAAPDFTVMWDNAYCVHEFTGGYAPFPSILALAEKAGSADMFYEFSSTSKITFPGSGISCMACSTENLAFAEKYFAAEIISYDKLNQLRHVRFLKDRENTLAHMKKHAALLGPKFAAVQSIFNEELAPLGVASWTDPKGGYFVSFKAMPGTAKRIVSLVKDAGVTLTPAGAAFPYGIDPEDSHIRIAPSFPPLDDLLKALRVFCLAVKLASLEKLTSAE